jgi:hypothetical protein
MRESALGFYRLAAHTKAGLVECLLSGVDAHDSGEAAIHPMLRPYGLVLESRFNTYPGTDIKRPGSLLRA